MLCICFATTAKTIVNYLVLSQNPKCSTTQATVNELEINKYDITARPGTR